MCTIEAKSWAAPEFGHEVCLVCARRDVVVGIAMYSRRDTQDGGVRILIGIVCTECREAISEA